MPIVGVLLTQSTTTQGLTSRGVPMYLFKPADPTLIPRKVAWKNADHRFNHWVVVEPTDEIGRIPRGTLSHVIGTCGDWSAERSALLWSAMPHKWPKKLPEIRVPPERPLLDMPTVHIDPPGCQDIDDAISIRGHHFAISIADVSAWLELNPWLREAEEQCCSLQDSGYPIMPMFPPELSEDKMSLIPGKRRPAMVMEWDWTPETGVTNLVLHAKDIIVTGSQTYGSAHDIKEFPVQTLKAFIADLAGPTEDPHVWIEILMIFQGRMVARALRDQGKGILRCQSAPDLEKLERQQKICPMAVNLSNSRAEQVDVKEATPHFGIHDQQCHVTSPLRRWVDVLNQLAVQGKEYPVDLEHIRARDILAKRQNREMFFLEELEFPTYPLRAIAMTPEKLQVPKWKRLVQAPNDKNPGEWVSIKQHLNMDAPTWKRRMVIQILS